MEQKPGWKTTEFWMTLVNAIVMVLIATGVIRDTDGEQIKSLAGPFVAAVLPIVLYVWSRTKVKAG